MAKVSTSIFEILNYRVSLSSHSVLNITNHLPVHFLR